jgi:WD40 repeat protein
MRVAMLFLVIFGNAYAFAQSDPPYPKIDPGNAAQVTQLAIEGRGTARQLAWSPDSKMLAVGGSLGVSLYDVGHLEEAPLQIVPDFDVSSIAFNSKGDTLAVGTINGSVILWDTNQREVRATHSTPEYWITSLAFNPEGTLLATVSWSGMLRLWNVATGEEQNTFPVDTE